MCPSPAPELHTPITDTHTLPTTTARDPLMLKQMLIPPSSTTPTDMVPLVPTPMVLPLMADTEFCHTEVLPPPTTLWDTL